MELKDVINKEVLDSGGNHIGRVIDLIFDLPVGQISFLVVKAGIIKKYNIPVEKLAKIGDKIILTVAWDSAVAPGTKK